MIRALTAAVALGLPAALWPACAAPRPSFQDRRAADHNRIGAQSFQQGDLTTAALHFERALEIARGLADRRQHVDALNNLGIVNETLGQAEPALQFYERSLELASSEANLDEDDPLFTRYELGIYSAALNRSRLLLNLGRLDESEQSLELASAAAAELGSRITRANCQKQRALLEQKLGRTASAFDLAREAVRLYEISDDNAANIAGLADATLILGRLLLEQGEPIDAIAKFRSANRLARQVSDRTLMAVSLELIGQTLVELGHLEDAELPYRMALDVNRRIPHAARARRNVVALLDVGQRLERADLIRECQELLAEIDGVKEN